MKFIKRKEEYGDIKDWIPIFDIDKNKIITKYGYSARVLEVHPVNFKLKSQNEQLVILENYKNFFKLCGFDIQILVQTQKTNIQKHIDNIKNNIKEEEPLYEMAKEYINLIENITYEEKSISRKFYIIIKDDDNSKENLLKIKEGLSMCGNNVYECDDLKIKKILSVCLNKRLANMNG